MRAGFVPQGEIEGGEIGGAGGEGSADCLSRQLLLFTANRSSMLMGMEACEGVHYCGRALLSHSQADANWMAQGTAVTGNSGR